MSSDAYQLADGIPCLRRSLNQMYLEENDMNVFRTIREHVFNSSQYCILLLGIFICSSGVYAVPADEIDWGWRVAQTFPNEAYGPRTDVNPDLIGDNHLFDVWCPDVEGQYPVMIYAHGGGFGSGSKVKALGSMPNVAKDNVVFISINYTLRQGGKLQSKILLMPSII